MPCVPQSLYEHGTHTVGHKIADTPTHEEHACRLVTSLVTKAENWPNNRSRSDAYDAPDLLFLLVRHNGFEPLTLGLEVPCSIQLS